MSHGFTTQYGPYCSGIDYFKHTRKRTHDFHRNQQTIEEKDYYTDLLSDETVRIIQNHDEISPFFIYLPYGAPHDPLQAPKAEIERYKHLGKRKAIYAAMVAVIDQGIGRILDALDKKGYTDNTLIVFMSDNGGQSKADNRPLRGRKGSLYEGGIRVVAAAHWPKRIPAGTICDKRCSYIDILPTLMGATGHSLPADIAEKLDGQNVLPFWEAKEGLIEEKDFYTFYERRTSEQISIIEGDWKLIRRGDPILNTDHPEKAQIELFNLSEDIGEKNNLASAYPERVEALLAKLVTFRKLRPEGGVPPMIEPFPKGWKPPTNWEPEE